MPVPKKYKNRFIQFCYNLGFPKDKLKALVQAHPGKFPESYADITTNEFRQVSKIIYEIDYFAIVCYIWLTFLLMFFSVYLAPRLFWQLKKVRKERREVFTSCPSQNQRSS